MKLNRGIDSNSPNMAVLQKKNTYFIDLEAQVPEDIIACVAAALMFDCWHVEKKFLSPIQLTKRSLWGRASKLEATGIGGNLSTKLDVEHYSDWMICANKT